MDVVIQAIVKKERQGETQMTEKTLQQQKEEETQKAKAEEEDRKKELDARIRVCITGIF